MAVMICDLSGSKIVMFSNQKSPDKISDSWITAGPGAGPGGWPDQSWLPRNKTNKIYNLMLDLGLRFAVIGNKYSEVFWEC